MSRNANGRWAPGGAVLAGTGLAAIVLILSACKVGPDYQRPEITLADSFINAEIAGPQQTEVDARWWKVFDDATLDELVTDAVTNNHDLRIAAATLRQAREMLIEARYQLYPIVPMQGGYERERLSEFNARGNSRDVDLVFGSLDATWELDLFGRVRRAVESREATVGQFEAVRRDVLVSVIAEVARNYFELRGNQGRLLVARQNAENQRSTLDLTTNLLDGGRGTELDTSRARAQLETTLAIIPPLETIIQQAAYRLAVLTGRQPGALLERLLAEAPLPQPPDSIAITDPETLLRRRPDVLAAERALAAATAQIGVDTADLYPRLTVVGSIGLEWGNVGGGFSGGPVNGFIGPRLTWAAFDLGRVKARIRGSEARAEAELAFFERTVLIALEEVDGTLVAYGRELERGAHLAAAEAASRQAATLARQRFEDGVEGFLNVLDAERRVLETQEQLAESRTRTATLLVAVYKALGGGWEEMSLEVEPSTQ